MLGVQVGCRAARTLGFGQHYEKVVEALGGHGELVTKASEIRPAIERAAASGLPACVNVHVEQHADATTASFGGYSSMLSR